MKDLLKILHSLFVVETQGSIFRLYIIFIIFGLLELISISSLFLISNVVFSLQSAFLDRVQEFSGFGGIELAFGALILLSLCYLLKVYQFQLIRKKLSEVGSKISYKLYAAYLNNEFSYYSKVNSSSIVSAIAYKMNGVMFGGLFPFLRLITTSSSLICVMISSFYIFGVISLTFIISLIFLCFSIMYFFRRKTGIVSKAAAIIQDKTIKNIQDSFINIKEIKVNDLSDHYSQVYSTDDRKLRQLQADSQYFSALGPIALEILILVPTLIVALIILTYQTNNFVFSGERLAMALVLVMRAMPYLLQIQNCAVVLSTSRDAILQVYDYYKFYDKSIDPTPKTQMLSGSNFMFENVSYSYDGTVNVLEDLNVSLVFSGITIINGPTGGGKSTLLDMMLGLLRPSCGKILFNGQKLEVRSDGETVFNGVGYLTQQAILPNLTIREYFKISLNISDAEILDLLSAVELLDVIKSRDSLDTVIGEQGHRFSGGQLQRIRLAKVLATKKSLIIIDEALNAVPLDMEARIIQRVNTNFSVDIVYVSHRKNNFLKIDQTISVMDKKVVVRDE